MSRVRPGEIARIAMVLLFFTAAPTAGDIGSCGQAIEDLDAAKFFGAKAQVDCTRCGECGIPTMACQNACGSIYPTEFAQGCYPLVHDGEACLNALIAASCEDYASYMADTGGAVPTECNFCPPGQR